MSRISCVLIAAGSFSPVVGKSLIRENILDILNIPFEEVITVTDQDTEAYYQALRDLPLKVTYNSDFALGQHSSIRNGLTHLRKYYDGVLVLRADDINQDLNVLQDMVRLFREQLGKSIVHPSGRSLNLQPMLIPREFVPDILQYEDGDHDCSYLLKRYPLRVAPLAVAKNYSADIEPSDDFSITLVSQHG
ncbi:NTP transferase domain-containing protein [Bdellovibrio sp. KM01]|uniref:NTP transferase domain-containing protein n=1 Tax=Bdellovibrio sp. KM01 TaxID=2748865 RepID=UPI0015E94D7D|nr:NTP transferase domain-containing protein [Bdellovibrio sp. KM01]QLY26337.1 NTP transferase domain-containing protein [Bdellovibrio sp. KM01]